jgi:signal transduction histidine kinase
MSFRTRLLLTSLATLLVGLGALLVTGNVLLDSHVRSETSDLLRSRADAQVAALAVTPDGVRVRKTANDAALDKQAWVFAGGKVLERPGGLAPSLDAAAVALADARGSVEADGPDDFRLRAQPVLDGNRQVATVVVVESTEPLENLQHRVLVGSLVIAGLILLAGGLAIRTAVDGALRPVVDMTAAAEDWGAHDLERRFALGPARDELTGLAATLDGLLARIAASRRHEQRFASEVAHELRTPLAGLRGRAELALDGDDREREGALRSIIHQTDRLDASIDTLMAVARRDLGDAGGTVDVTAVVGELQDVDIHATVEPVPPVEGDAELVRRMIAPLVDNAHRHARARVTVEVTADEASVRLAVCDDGPGLPPELRERVFEPGFQQRSGDGAGLGLPLARRLARTCGGDVTAEGGPGGRFVLSLPRADR